MSTIKSTKFNIFWCKKHWIKLITYNICLFLSTTHWYVPAVFFYILYFMRCMHKTKDALDFYAYNSNFTHSFVLSTTSLFRINLCMCIVYRVRIDWVSEQHATLFMRNLFNSLYFVFDLDLYIYQIYSECEKYLCIYLCILRALNCGIEFREFCSLYFVVTFEFYVDRSKKYFFFFFITSSFA